MIHQCAGFVGLIWCRGNAGGVAVMATRMSMGFVACVTVRDGFGYARTGTLSMVSLSSLLREMMTMSTLCEGQRVRLTRDLEDLRAGWLGTVQRGSDDELGVAFDGRPACVSVRRYLDGWIVLVVDYVELLEPVQLPVRSVDQCPDCEGTGVYDFQMCELCQGRGTVVFWRRDGARP